MRLGDVPRRLDGRFTGRSLASGTGVAVVCRCRCFWRAAPSTVRTRAVGSRALPMHCEHAVNTRWTRCGHTVNVPWRFGPGRDGAVVLAEAKRLHWKRNCRCCTFDGPSQLSQPDTACLSAPTTAAAATTTPSYAAHQRSVPHLDIHRGTRCCCCYRRCRLVAALVSAYGQGN
jgi:hypothetical protein